MRRAPWELFPECNYRRGGLNRSRRGLSTQARDRIAQMDAELLTLKLRTPRSGDRRVVDVAFSRRRPGLLAALVRMLPRTG